MRRFLTLLTLALVAAPAGAAAATPAPSGSGTGTLTPTATVARAARPAGVRLRWGGPHHAYGKVVGITGARARVRGTVAHYVKGRRVRVVVRRNGRRVLSRAVALGRTKDGRGTFLLVFRTLRSGSVQVRARGARRGLGMRVVAASSTSHLAVRLLQNGLAGERYLTGRTGYFDGSTQDALLAFRKYNRLPRTYGAGAGIALAAFQGRGAFRPRYRGARHAEGDLTHQVLALVNSGGKVYKVLPLSSGKPSTPTVLGNFRVYSKTPGFNSEGMFYSSYFTGGYAIHGYTPVPTYPASHGCLRIPPRFAVFAYRWLTYGTPVHVYYR